ncbi:alpha/beta fold hydrolase [Cellulomonas sp. S1-8]|uniref:alpha/beta fold hydrolase n=1 Tax=Cellulomonas sp. S1-8 TaxID=2904790 RepID=UPI00224354E8|nr:alpha/beta hydrolase [Cellulomonas sp. S1-8]UZN03250.1 alpha/beta hydrolase [Cellulomonas sp. S1-8]
MAGTAAVEPLTVHRSGNPASPTVVLLHGVTDSGTTWPDLLAHWGGTYDVLAPDLRGHGSSPRFTPDQLPDAPEVMLADVVALLDAQPAPVALIGHSLGGLLALRAALARPDRVRALVVEDPARPTGARRPEPGFSAMLLGGTQAAITDRDAEVARMRRETPWSHTEIDAWADSRPFVDPEYLREGLFLGDAAWEEAFDALAVPTLLVVPPDAPMAPRPDGFDNPLVRTVVVAGAGHCVRRDRPLEYHAAVDAFLAEHAAGG